MMYDYECDSFTCLDFFPNGLKMLTLKSEWATAGDLHDRHNVDDQRTSNQS